MSSAFVFDGLLTAVARGLVLPWYARKFRQFERQLQRARELQRSLLLARIERSRDTRFGRDHHFADIRTVNDFRQRMPVAGFDHFAPYIDAVSRGEMDALFPTSERLLRFTITTGTTGAPKLNPVTATWMKEYRTAWDLWNTKLVLDHPQIVGRKVLQLAGNLDMGRTPSGVAISMVSALASRFSSPIVRQFYALPDEIASICDPLAKYYTILRLTMTRNIGVIVAISPGTLLGLAELGNSECHSLIRDIHDGTLSSRFDIPDTVRARLKAYTARPAPEEARQLERLAAQRGTLYPREYWTNPVIGCWIGGTAGYQARNLPEYFGNAPLRDLGLVSSEGRHTIPLQDNQPAGVLAVTTNYYEFIPLVERDSLRPVALEAHELQEGCDYSLVMTTSGGYFRFEIGDVVRCRGYIGDVPVLEFLQKLGRCGDLEGEKLTEHQVVQAVDEAAAMLSLRLGYVTAVPSRPDRDRPCYVILVDHSDVPEANRAAQFIAAVDRRLSAGNFLYAAHRRAQLLGPPRLWRLPNAAWSRYVQAQVVCRGTGDTQYKHPALVTDASLLGRFSPVDIIECPGPENRSAA
jgi:hypothetical protein